MGKLNGTDIILKNKPGSVYNRGIFFTKKNYALDLCIICDFSKRFIYILANWPNFQYDAKIYSSKNL